MKFDVNVLQNNNVKDQSRLTKSVDMEACSNYGKLSKCRPRRFKSNLTSATQQSFAFGTGCAEPKLMPRLSEKEFNIHHHASVNATLSDEETGRSVTTLKSRSDSMPLGRQTKTREHNSEVRTIAVIGTLEQTDATVNKKPPGSDHAAAAKGVGHTTAATSEKEEDLKSSPTLLHESKEEQDCIELLHYQDTHDRGEGKRKHTSIKPLKTDKKKVKDRSKHSKHKPAKTKSWLYYLTLFFSR